jgi:hypothetical protein
MPRLDDSGIDRAEVRLPETRKVRIIFPQNLHHPPPVVAMLRQRNDLQPFDHAFSLIDLFHPRQTPFSFFKGYQLAFA